MKLTEKQRNTLLKLTRYETDGVQIRSHYSGRCMYGRSCVGFVGDFGDVLPFLIQLGAELESLDDNGFLNELNQAAMDNMGMDIIVYFPKVEWGAEPLVNKEDEEDFE